MNRWTVLFVAVAISLFVAIGCSGNGGASPVAPATGPEVTSGPDFTGQAVSSTNTSVLGYYDCYFDVESQTMEVLEDRTAMYTLNIIPFLNQMTSPQYGITFGSLVVDESDPAVIKVAVEFIFHHPFPMLEQYKCYDFMGAIVTNGDSSIDYDGLMVGNYGTDTYMTNADCYTRWMNPSEFTTELIFGWAPGGIQNLVGNANLNPAKSYGMGLGAEDSVWDWLTGGMNNEGIFETGMGRIMNLEFPFPDDGLAFGYLALCCWEEQFDGPYTPYHRDEPIACQLEVSESLWYDGTSSGGNLIADISLWSWEAPPSVVKVESTVIAGSVDATGPTPGGDNVSVWSVDVTAEPLTTTEGHEVWVIAECSAYGYYPITELGEVLDIPSANGALAAFFRFPLVISPEQFNSCPNIVSGVTGKTDPHSAETCTYNVTATDPESDPLTYFWVVTDVLTGMPIGAYNGVQGDGAGNLDIDFSLFAVTGNSYDINCDVYDPLCFTSADTLTVTIVCYTEYVSCFPDYGQKDDPAATVLIELTNCEDGPDFAASLDNGVDPTIIGSALTWVDNTHFSADFDLTGAPLDLYDLTVVNGCGGPSDVGLEAFEIISAGPVLKTCGDLPGPFATNDEHDISVVGTTGFGHDGVYYHYSTDIYNSFQVWHYPLDYSAAATVHCNISDPFFFNIAGLLRNADDLRAIEVMAQGSFSLSNWNSQPMSWGGYPANGPVWWGGPDGALDNGYLYFNMQFHDLEREFSSTGRHWGYWGNNPAGVDGATYILDPPYGQSNYGSYTGYYPADHSGSVDGMISDNEAYWHAVDSDPEGLSSPFNRIFYYLEGPPDDYGIEIMQNVFNMAFPVSLGTIDAPYDDTGVIPVDITVVNTFGNTPSCTEGNWLCVLEDNGDTTWSFAVFQQDGDLVGRIGPYDGTPWHLDADVENQEAHVWYDDAGTPRYCIFEFL